ncbi:molybdopterin converting factor subunit 1 [Magnetospirillum moscoviense]|uniref:Molybdopterin synthase sulfur carrier subunit n=1 Tax=Magnetospirillum moscoviense TaxID=1437059 RepID=A0A178MWF6_9PROT|nr:molybdopterin converting factor subunit 1 [Magnetospirillum moscoviense]MBF0326502.1 molybdopterin converting factor subunit 1 [Alphaproteobacteria bacterium]OAN53226.1 molybdopterin synthase sulfur carrier subunit [Magnetospirillum moscoviense]
MKILYFAWLKAKTGTAEEEVSPPAAIATIADLVEWLKGRSPGHADALSDLRLIRVAVNQDHVGLDHPVGPNDEVAFFPPVTGGGR